MHEAVLTRETTLEPDRPFAKWPVFSAAAALATAHLVLSPFGGHWIDEIYMLAAGKHHLDWGYVDQPPVVPLLAAAMDRIAPGSLPVLRLPAILATAAAVVMTALVARELGGDRRAQVLAAGAFATGLWTNLAAHWTTPYTIEPLLWITLTWLLVRWFRVRDDRLLLALGAVAGLTMQTKFQVALLGLVLLVTAAIFGPRDLLRRPLLWAGIGLAVLIASPTLIWQAAHGWPQLQMGAVVAAESPVLSGGRSGTAVQQVLYAGVAGTFLLLVGLWRMLSAPEHRALRFVGVTFLVLHGFFVATAGRPYYLIGLYGILVAVGAVGLQRRREAGARRFSWVAWPAYALSVAALVPLVPISLDLSGAFGLPSRTSLAEHTAVAYRSLPAETRVSTAIFGHGYPLAATIDVLGREHGLPGAHSPHRGYGFFGPPADSATSVLYVGDEPSALRPYFAETRLVADGEVEIWLCSGRSESWSVIWPRIRSL